MKLWKAVYGGAEEAIPGREESFRLKRQSACVNRCALPFSIIHYFKKARKNNGTQNRLI